MILLDTHALIWISQGHAGARKLERSPSLFVSPATVLELQILVETGRVRAAGRWSSSAIGTDPRWRIDAPPADRWFDVACQFAWTRDPFDRLIAAHARLRRWKLATADELLLERLPASDLLPL